MYIPFNEIKIFNLNHCADINKIVRQARLNYYSEKISSSGCDLNNLFKVAKHL